MKGTQLFSRNLEFGISLDLVRVIVSSAQELCHFGQVGKNWLFFLLNV